MSAAPNELPELGVAVIGHSFMGAVHSHAWRSVDHVGTPRFRTRRLVLAGRDLGRAQAAATQFGWDEGVADWREVIARDDVHVVDVLTPGDSHAEIAIAALEAGKHVICEKPLAKTVEEAQRMTAAAQAAAAKGVRSMVAFNYRQVPAIGLARQLVEAGRLGEVRQVRAVYLQDWIVDPEFPLTWRLQKDRSGAGALGDIGSHIIDAAQFITGQRLLGVSGTVETFVKTRPLEAARTGSNTGLGAEASTERGEVTVDDAAVFFGRGDGGALMTFEASRMALGRKNGMRIEVNGSKGSIAFDFESMNELHFFDGTLPDAENGFRRILATEPEHPGVSNWWPAGHGLGYDHPFVHELQEFLGAIADERDPSPSFADGLQVQQVLDAVQRSAENDSAYTTI
ncbi:Gfo/Idh/MocA family protein [Kineococcus radiotolerans]|uniref:Oxidoreductase domain protein n=1 Tax=Kineococcus radiotolerans (strain ATCC BAA-149 / DSM 14245 / SRS30216) TaxID=266940 RepID=A6W4Z1_KINRD|nr:Gfo/Idh/MocA family oxidoreductase [Kineococcus radiotolerans]ABS01880.1 oxidoreductase domain protein [Kineococcus radiotolerans SRS30216 = ATCC BAA-149]